MIASFSARVSSGNLDASATSSVSSMTADASKRSAPPIRAASPLSLALRLTLLLMDWLVEPAVLAVRKSDFSSCNLASFVVHLVMPMLFEVNLLAPAGVDARARSGALSLAVCPKAGASTFSAEGESGTLSSPRLTTKSSDCTSPNILTSFLSPSIETLFAKNHFRVSVSISFMSHSAAARWTQYLLVPSPTPTKKFVSVCSLSVCSSSLCLSMISVSMGMKSRAITLRRASCARFSVADGASGSASRR